MSTPKQQKSDIDKLWTECCTGGITNPLTAIEQISFLMFLDDPSRSRLWEQYVGSRPAFDPAGAPQEFRRGGP